jgi:transcriptional regulator with XRE-family HTH domain
MNSTQERLDFSNRLQQALRNAEYSPSSPTQLAREFNERFSGHPVTVHAARKWLQGESIPTQEKLRALASWLNVPADWLRFGNAIEPRAKGQAAKTSPTDSKIIATLEQLDDHHKSIALEFLRALARLAKNS